ncbi:M4 family metallopeptidase [Streptomyces triculaminicus]|uniref:M4 family metallopeptidase n=1 Tax=Streptomyces triculaminicus TaxID=2816232 RepID=UPI0037D88712
MRRNRARSGRPAAKGGIAGAAALIGAAALVVTTVPGEAFAAPSVPAPSPSEVIPGTGTSTPALVDGIREGVKSTGSAADAARGHLADKRDRYRIADPGRDLKPLRTTSAGSSETVRLQQKHRGIDVLGGQYVVRMEKKDGKRVVTGTSGKYFTALKADTKADVSEETAVERAVDATLAQLGRAGGFGADGGEGGEGDEGAPSLTGTARGLVIVPKGAGVLAHHVTVRGTDRAGGQPVLREVYVDAKAGYPVLQYSGIKTFGAPAAASGGAAQAPRAKAAADAPGVRGSGVTYDGTTVELQLTQDDGSKEYLMRDHSRMRDSSKNVLSTWDARGKDVSETSGRWPEGIKEFGSKGPQFSQEFTEAGAVDAHWAAGKVYDYYKQAHGRDSLDGRGMTINSLVGVTYFGMPYVNAFWDGTKMVYGSGDKEYRTLSAGLDVVGHEMTHGVVENTANLVYAGQSGALNEAVADYFGNAIKTDAYGTSMDSPDSGLLGERLCRTKTPRECAIRDLNDGRTTSKSFLGVSFATDNGGVHLNSTIFSGALWDIRKDVDRALADRIVYKALTEYMTPLDGFTEGRNAVIAAAKALKVPAKDRNAVTRAFNAHGIVPNWEQAMGVDSDQLLGRLNTDRSRPGAGGGWWTASRSNDNGSEAYSVWAGRADGKGSPKLMSPNDGRYHVNPATDGKTVVWEAYGPTGIDLLSRPLAGGPVKKVWSNRRLFGSGIEGGIVVWVDSPHPAVGTQAKYLRIGDKEPTELGNRTGRRDTTAVPAIGNGKIVYAMRKYIGRGYGYSVDVHDVASGRTTAIQPLTRNRYVGAVGVTGKHVFWIVDDEGRAVRRANVDGTGVVDISRDRGPDALHASDLTVSEQAVTVTASTPGAQDPNAALPKLWQFTVDGTRLGRVSCNRGEQSDAAAVGGKQVVWLDGTTGYTDLVTRTRPAGTCG